jgi:Type IV leader peptidase family
VYLLLLFIIYLPLYISDWRHREINQYWTLVFLAATIFVGGQHFEARFFSIFFANMSFLIFQGLLLTIYFSLRQKKWTNIADSYIGWGDIWVLVGMCCLFDLRHYIYFLILSLIIGLVGHFIYWKKEGSIPFVSVMGIGAGVLVVSC